MRKFYRAIVACVAVLSVAGFLLYKHKYDQVVNVLRVLNTFGHPCEKVHTLNASDLVVPHSFSSWQQINDVYFYSAYWDNRGRFGTASPDILLLGMAPSTVQVFLKCMLWHDGKDEPSMAQLLRYGGNGTHEETNALVPAWFICKPDDVITSMPYAISLVSDDRFQATKSAPFIYVRPILKDAHFKSPKFAMCVWPLTDLTEDLPLLKDFILFHHSLQIDHFIIYDSGTPPGYQLAWHSMKARYPKLSFQFLSWNVPYLKNINTEDAARRVLQEDCILRTAHTHTYVTLANINQFLVPRHHFSYEQFVKDEEEISNQPVGAFIFKEHDFCTEFPDGELGLSGAITSPMVVRKNHWINVGNIEIARPVLIQSDFVISFSNTSEPTFIGGLHSQKVSTSIASIHTYKKCFDVASKDAILKAYSKSTEDTVLMKFAQYLDA